MVSSCGIKSSSRKSSKPVATTLVRRSSPNFSFKARISSLITFKIFAGLFKSKVNSAIIFFFSASSFSIFSRSRLAKVCNFISKIASVCNSENLKFFIKFAFASERSLDFLIVEITLSMIDSALDNPIKICARSSAFRKSCWARRRTISFRWAR